MNSEEIGAVVREREAERCRALVAKDIAALQQIVATGLVHIHANGQVDDRDAYFRVVESNLDFLEVLRGDLTVIPLARAAIATGRLEQLLRVRATGQEVRMKAVTTQVWVEQDGSWKQASFQATSLPDTT